METHWIHDKLPIDVNNINHRDFDGRTALIRASERGDVLAVKRLLEIPNININVLDNCHFTALQWACKCNHIEVVKVLLNQSHINITGVSEITKHQEILDLIENFKNVQLSAIFRSHISAKTLLYPQDKQIAHQESQIDWLENSTLVKTILDIFFNYEKKFNKINKITILEELSTPYKSLNRICILDEFPNEKQHITELFSDAIEMVSIFVQLINELYSEYNYVKDSCSSKENSYFHDLIEKISDELRKYLLIKQKLLVTECEFNGFILNDYTFRTVCELCKNRFSYHQISACLSIKRQLNQLPTSDICHICMITELNNLNENISGNFEDRPLVCPFTVSIDAQEWSFPYICHSQYVESELNHIIECNEFDEDISTMSKMIRFLQFTQSNHPTVSERGLNIESYLLISNDYWQVCHCTAWKLRQRPDRCFGDIHVKSLYSVAEKIIYRGKPVNDILRTRVNIQKFEDVKKVAKWLSMERIDNAKDTTSLSQTKNNIKKLTYVFTIEYNQTYYPMWLEVQFFESSENNENVSRQQRMEHIEYELIRLKRARTKSDFERVGLTMHSSDLLVDIGNDNDSNLVLAMARSYTDEGKTSASIMSILQT